MLGFKGEGSLVISSFQTLWLLVKRNVLFWLMIFGVFIFNCYLFYMLLFEYKENPGDLLVANSYMVQVGIFASLFLGVLFVRVEQKHEWDQLLRPIHLAYIKKMIGKLLFAIVAIASLCLIIYFMWSIMVFLHGVPFSTFYLEAFFYILLYWGITFFISLLIGILSAELISNLFVYFVIFFIWLVIGPLNDTFFKEFFIYFPESILGKLSRELNLGEYNPYMLYDALYGFSLEGYHWVKRWIWLTILLSLLFLVISVKQRLSKAKYIPIFSVLIVLSVPAWWYVNIPQQVLQSNASPFDRDRYDYLHYNEYATSNESNSQKELMILSYDIDLTIDNRLKAKVDMEVKNIDTLSDQKARFSLYHRFNVSNISSDGEQIPYEQKDDFVTVDLSNHSKSGDHYRLTFEYEGISSPLFTANHQSIHLPYYFPWLPSTNPHSAMHYEGFSLHRLNHSEPNKVHYQLTMHGHKPVYTNLERTGRNTWEKTTSEGLTILSGLLGEKQVGGLKVVYPLSWERGLESMSNVEREAKQITEHITSDLQLPHVDFPKTLIIIPVLSMADIFDDTEQVWLTKEFLLINMRQGTRPDRDMLISDDLVYRLLPALTWKRERIEPSDYEFYVAFNITYGVSYNLLHDIADDKEMARDRISQMIQNTDDVHQKNALQAVQQIISHADHDTLHEFSRQWYDIFQTREQVSWKALKELANKFVQS